MTDNKSFRCDICQRDFSSSESLAHHKRDRHDRLIQESIKKAAQQESESRLKDEELHRIKTHERKKKIKKITIISLILLSVIVIFFVSRQLFIAGQENKEALRLEGVPMTPIHWHPQLKIIIDGEEQQIPEDIGLTSNIHYPIHTHDEDANIGVVHMENDNPNSENVRLGYFFKVWGKKFNDQCIFDYCVDENHELKFYVNGKENNEYENYIMHDKNNLRIEYLTIK